MRNIITFGIIENMDGTSTVLAQAENHTLDGAFRGEHDTEYMRTTVENKDIYTVATALLTVLLKEVGY